MVPPFVISRRSTSLPHAADQPDRQTKKPKQRPGLTRPLGLPTDLGLTVTVRPGAVRLCVAQPDRSPDLVEGNPN